MGCAFMLIVGFNDKDGTTGGFEVVGGTTGGFEVVGGNAVAFGVPVFCGVATGVAVGTSALWANFANAAAPLGVSILVVVVGRAVGVVDILLSFFAASIASFDST